MLEKIKKCWTSLDRKIIVNQRELVLGAAVCALAGIVIGTFLSPNVNVTIGSNNSNITDRRGCEETEEEDEACVQF